MKKSQKQFYWVCHRYEILRRIQWSAAANLMYENLTQCQPLLLAVGSEYNEKKTEYQQVSVTFYLVFLKLLFLFILLFLK